MIQTNDWDSFFKHGISDSQIRLVELRDFECVGEVNYCKPQMCN